MKKEYFANKEYNKSKRRNSIFLSIILTMLLLFMASIYAVKGDYGFALIFALLLVIPIAAIPAGFKNYPLHDKPIVVIENGVLIANDKTFKIKEIKKLNVIIELPSSKIDKDDIETLERLKKEIPEDLYFGTFDIVYDGGKKKSEIEYAHIDHVVDALYQMVDNGLRKYDLKFTIKKNTVVNECDLKKVLDKQKQENALNKTTAKERKRQLI